MAGGLNKALRFSGQYFHGVVALLLCLWLPVAWGATLFGVVTDRSAPAAVAAARRYVAAHPGDRIQLSTPAQIVAASDRQLQQWLKADAVLVVSVFGDPARRLGAALSTSRVTRILAMNGEARLTLLSRDGQHDLSQFPPETLRELAAETPKDSALAQAAAHPLASRWLAARRTWQAGGPEHIAQLYDHLLHHHDLSAPQPEPGLRLRVQGYERQGQQVDDLLRSPWQPAAANTPLPAQAALVVLDLSNSEAQTAAALCAESRRQGMACVELLSRWGATSRMALERLPELVAPARPAALIVVQDFVVGAAEHREAVTEALKNLNIPVLKALRLSERTPTQWRLSPEGLPVDSVQYRVALPELQGIGQPVVVSGAGPSVADALTGIEMRQIVAIPEEVRRLVGRAVRWQQLAAKANHDKRLALIYYNHPPGRQNIGADNLDVPASLFHILTRLKAEGYDTGPEAHFPPSAEALLEQIMARGVNLPEDQAALRQLAGEVASLSAPGYGRLFAQLPPRVQGEMVDGPLGRLHADVLVAEQAGERSVGRKRVVVIMKELLHLVEGADHPRREAAIRDLRALEAGYLRCLADGPRHPCRRYAALKKRLIAYGIEGLRGWGAAPGKVMVSGGRMLVPGLQFGKIFIGAQPPRGWEVDEELLHANTSVPPPHQFLGFYHWLRDRFRADALVHLGRHSTYEFLPGKAVGLSADDYPSLIAADLPGIYPYIVDGVGEGIQAKRRGLAVMVDHLTPPLAATPLYDRLLELRQVVESYEAANSDSLKANAAKIMREHVVALNLKAELEASMADVLEVRGIGFEDADDDLLAHEVGHYLTKLQEKFMPHGLHVFGKDWSEASLQLMSQSMAQVAGNLNAEVEHKLRASPRLEMQGLLAGLNGAFVPPGKGNDPLRSPDALPTGRNFHAVDGDILPTRLGFKLGADLATKALARSGQKPGSEAVILWASDAVRDEGAMVAFCLALLGAEPVWNARGIVTDVRLLEQVPHRDVIVTTSGLFRDLYPNLLNQIDRAGRLALAASALSLVQAHPEAQEPLRAALAPVATQAWGSLPLADNALATAWWQRYQQLRAQGEDAQQAGRGAALRIFGDAPGAYSAGVNRLAERSGAWQERRELGAVYLKRMGHAYGLDATGEAAHAGFAAALQGVSRSYHGRASNLYGLMDNNDAFDYLGGLSLGVENLTGHRPEGLILQHADPAHAAVEPLATALMSELRGRYLNPEWLKPLMQHGYAGARTMGQEFLENLWGWQVTRPDLVQQWAWDEVKRTYFDDQHKLGLPQFLAQGHNAHVKAQMLAIFMVAAHKGYWRADEATLRRLGGELAELVAKNGLPGSGHTAPNHPMWAWLAPQLSTAQAQALGVVLAKARGELLPSPPTAASRAIAPRRLEPVAPDQAPPSAAAAAKYYELKPELDPVSPATFPPAALWWLFLTLFSAGVFIGRRTVAKEL